MASVAPVTVTILSGQAPSDMLILAPLCQQTGGEGVSVTSLSVPGGRVRGRAPYRERRLSGALMDQLVRHPTNTPHGAGQGLAAPDHLPTPVPHGTWLNS